MTADSEIDLKDIGREKSLVYMMIPDEKKTLYPLVSIVQAGDSLAASILERKGADLDEL